MAVYKWRALDGRFDVAANWANTTLRINPARVPPGASDVVTFDTGGGIITGVGAVAALTTTGNNSVPWTIAGQFVALSTLIGGTVTISAGGSLDGGTLSVGTSGTLAVASSGALRADGLTLQAGSRISVAPGGIAAIGAPSGSAGALSVGAGAVVTAHAGSIDASVRLDGTLASDGGLAVTGDVTGAGALALGAGLTRIDGSAGVGSIAFGDPGAILRVGALQGAATVSNFAPGNAIDVVGGTAYTLGQGENGPSLTIDGATLALAAAPANSEYRVYGDGRGGIQLLLDSPPPANAVEITDVVTHTSSVATGDVYVGPVDYLQRQYILPGNDAIAMHANTPNVFLKGGGGDDALKVSGGNNVLDGGSGSNFLVGGIAPDGVDTFFLDGRGGAQTWSTIVNFHPGDQATIFGFHAGLSTRPYTESDGVQGYTGLTIHSELNGAGTGVQASLTFAGINSTVANTNFAISSGTLAAGTPDATDYLLVRYLA
jgi:hypothetical protein